MLKHLQSIGWLLDQIGASGRLGCELARSFAVPQWRRAAYVGWVGHANLGDEAIYDVIQAHLPYWHLRHFGGARKEAMLQRIFGAQRLYRYGLLGGGTLILGGYADQLEVLQQSGIPCRTFGTGVVDWAFWAKQGMPDENERWKPLLSRMGRLYVRGPRSQERLHALGLTDVEVSGDPALLLALPQVPPTVEARIIGISYNEPKIGLTVQPRLLFEIYREVGSELMRQGWELRFFAVAADDYADNLRLAHALGLPRSSVERHWHSGPGYVHAVSRCQLFLGMRLHSAILSHCAYVPAVLLGYQDKSFDYMESVRQDRWVIPPPGWSAANILGLLAEAERGREALIKAIWENVARYHAGLQQLATNIFTSEYK